MKARNPVIYLAGLFTAAALLSIVVQPDSPTALQPPAATAASPSAIPDLIGTWAGAWEDTVYDVTGDLTFVIWGNPTEIEASGEIDVSSLGLGTLTGEAGGTGDGNTLTGAFTCLNLGSGSGTLLSSGEASGSGTVTAPLDFGPFTFTGTVSGNMMTGAFEFTSPGGGKGIASLTRTTVETEPVPWGEVKALYR